MGVMLSIELCIKRQQEIEYMLHVPYASFVGNLMSAMVCTQPHISHLAGVLSR